MIKGKKGWKNQSKLTTDAIGCEKEDRGKKTQANRIR